VLKIDPHNIMAPRQRAGIKQEKGDVAGAKADFERELANTNAKEDESCLFKAIGEQPSDVSQAGGATRDGDGASSAREALRELEKMQSDNESHVERRAIYQHGLLESRTSLILWR
jgi:hypothetical protein